MTPSDGGNIEVAVSFLLSLLDDRSLASARRPQNEERLARKP
jgi:hypothetical protein